MSLTKRGRIYYYDFVFHGHRYYASTEQTTEADAQLVEDQVKARVRREAHGLIAAHPEQSPRIAEWAVVYMDTQKRRLTRPDVLQRTLRVVLAFWGRPPSGHRPPVDGGPYHDLRLIDPILDPRWLDRFEAWMDQRGVAGSTRNSYLSAMSGLYKLAAKARYRAQTGIDRNPFADVGRFPTTRREVTATPADLRRWIAAAEPHVALALTIGGLAHKLRLAQVLAVRFDAELDEGLTRIVFDQHKTRRHTGRPQVTIVSAPLRAVLEAVRKTRPRGAHVVTWRGKPVESITTGLRRAAKRAGLVYGMQPGGVTFHAVRHIAASELARMGVSAALAAKASGHKDPRTTEQHYMHLVPDDERAIVDELAERLALSDEALRAAGKIDGTHQTKAAKTGPKTTTADRTIDPGKPPTIH